MASVISNSGSWPVKGDSLLSNEKPPVAEVSLRAMPLFATVPLAQCCTREVTSTSTNWLTLEDAIAVGLLLVADNPGVGALVKFSDPSAHGVLTSYTSKLPADVAAST